MNLEHIKEQAKMAEEWLKYTGLRDGDYAFDDRLMPEAMAAWNNRPIEDKLQQRIDELEDALLDFKAVNGFEQCALHPNMAIQYAARQLLAALNKKETHE